ncbi:cell division protein ZapA [Roseicella sp. DB1501]|uniref:cell division protein ZapA n=1 Tax=Roseicella sp. DB1501 TaxID=2730925 RepID=UPI00149250E1|nr:cell division protein ZapA [Roseicella sp. DB1501]
MGQVTVRVNGYQHTIGCKDGEEAHVLDLVQQIEEKVRLIRAMGGQFSESRMLLHVALLLADEGADLRTEMVRARAGLAPAAPAAPDPQLAERLARIAERIEGLAQTLDRG